MFIFMFAVLSDCFSAAYAYLSKAHSPKTLVQVDTYVVVVIVLCVGVDFCAVYTVCAFSYFRFG